MNYWIFRKSCFKWSRESCKIGQKSSVTTICECTTLGTFSITNDLYDPNVSVLCNYINFFLCNDYNKFLFLSGHQ